MNQPLYFEGSAVVKRVISTGSSFCVTEHGDAYVPRSITEGYNLSTGDTFMARVRRNHTNYDGSCEFVVIDLMTTPTTSTTVASHTQGETFDDDAIPSWDKLSEDERWQAVDALSDDQPMFTTQQLMHYLGFPEEYTVDAACNHVESYLKQLVHDKNLWAVDVHQGTDENPDFFYSGYMIDPNVKFNGHFMFYHAEYQKVRHSDA